jgi:hypothetical protein
MPAAVPGEKNRRRPVQIAGDERVGRLTEGSVKADFLYIGKSLHLIEAAAADDSDYGFRHVKSSWNQVQGSKFKIQGSRFKVQNFPFSFFLDPLTSFFTVPAAFAAAFPTSL